MKSSAGNKVAPISEEGGNTHGDGEEEELINFNEEKIIKEHRQDVEKMESMIKEIKKRGAAEWNGERELPEHQTLKVVSGDYVFISLSSICSE